MHNEFSRIYTCSGQGSLSSNLRDFQEQYVGDTHMILENQSRIFLLVYVPSTTDQYLDEVGSHS